MKQNRWYGALVVAALAVGVVAVMATRKPETQGARGGWSAARRPTALPRLIELGSVDCIPCKMMAPILDELRKEEAGRLEITFIDIDQDRAAAVRYKVRMKPTQVLLSPSGKELLRHEGYWPKEDILAALRKHGIPVAGG